MEAADLREDMRLVVSELQRESNRSKKLANQKAEIAETVKSLTNEKVQLEEKIANMDDEIQEVYEKLEDANNLLNDLTEAHRDTCDHLADVTKEKVSVFVIIKKLFFFNKPKHKNSKLCNEYCIIVFQRIIRYFMFLF